MKNDDLNDIKYLSTKESLVIILLMIVFLGLIVWSVYEAIIKNV